MSPRNTSQSSTRSGTSGTVRLRSGIVTLLLGIGLMVAMVVVHFETTAFASTAQRATGTVVDNVSQRHTATSGQQSRTVYHLVVEFTAADGTEVTFTSDSEHSEPIPDGGSVPVLYQPTNPQNARLASDLSLWWLWWAFAGGAVLALLGGWLLVTELRARRRSSAATTPGAAAGGS